ncbi:hypothetical protein [Bradyrhizobium canariense]|uniref:Uncharacterized protein n=1 Tax=Bradyrhizobium canariense TaxID=255045 RepID=A0A1H1XIV0_9BRAD|nr:hypothetical protein [Bradyrhizobium canariense]SDT08656.1 hypothetical protein SAMN05444158_4326 [Bradyrhizobium canariense]
MTETVPNRPFDEAEALAWLRSQPDGRVTASAAELGREWGWNRMRAGRRLRAWEQAGNIRRNAEEIIATTSVTPAITESAGVAVTHEATVTRRSMTPVKLAAFMVALLLACVSAAFSIDGLTAIFAGAFWPVIIMGATLEAGKLVAAAWLTENWYTAPALLRLILVAMIGLMMSLNAVGVFGFLTKAHLDHMVTVDLALADKVADTEARLAIQGQTVADLDRRIAQIDAAIEESTRLGRPVGAMTIADQKRRDRADIVATRQREAGVLANLQIDKARVDAQRRRAEADVGPVRYLAELIGMPSADLERPVRMLTLALVVVLDPMAVVLLLAAGANASASSR